jgi:hypothetical protein
MLQHIDRHIIRHMGKAFLPAFAIAALLWGSPAAEPAGPARQSATPLRVATVLCGSNGCTPVQTKQVQRRKFQTMGHG